MNSKGIDLIDYINHIIVQVSSDFSKSKIQESLDKINAEDFSGFKFIFLAISEERKKNWSFRISDEIIFNPATNIITIRDIVDEIENMEIGQLNKLPRLIVDEIGNSLNRMLGCADSDLAEMINILGTECEMKGTARNPWKQFDIQKKVCFNQLQRLQRSFEEASLYIYRIDDIYKEFDSEVHNKSGAVLNQINRFFNRTSDDLSPVAKFYETCESVVQFVLKSKNYKNSLSIEQLNDCAELIVAHAFFKCRIFSNPEVCQHVVE